MNFSTNGQIFALVGIDFDSSGTILIQDTHLDVDSQLGCSGGSIQIFEESVLDLSVQAALGCVVNGTGTLRVTSTSLTIGDEFQVKNILILFLYYAI